MNVQEMPSVLEPSVSFGAVMHARHAQALNRFNYPIAFLRLPLSRLEALSVPLLGIGRRNVFSVRYEDHGARDGSALLPWIRELLAKHDLAAVTSGEVVLQTMPRILGYVFNPVSFWFCHDDKGALRVVLAEVSNTFGEHHNYLVHHDDMRPIARHEELVARKVFHVSPFFPVKGEYRFRFDIGPTQYAVGIDYYDGELKQLSTRVRGEPRALNGAAMGRWLLRQPLMTFGVIFRIHWQALRLALKRVKFFRKPVPPLEETTR